MSATPAAFSDPLPNPFTLPVPADSNPISIASAMASRRLEAAQRRLEASNERRRRQLVDEHSRMVADEAENRERQL
eukprot:3353144-Prymnesium_polylepis.1